MDMRDQIVQGASMAKCMPTDQWTNEKHRVYLKSMESTFVDQLYGYMDLIPHPSDPNLMQQQQLESPISTASGKKVYFQRPAQQQQQRRVNAKVNDQGCLLKSPWIQHYRSARKPQTIVPSTTPQHSDTLHSSRPTCHHDTTNNYTEMSDQNFVDEDSDESEKATSTCISSKRVKLEHNQCS
ncbi:Cold-regulated protein 27 [Linum grandiflorum]